LLNAAVGVRDGAGFLPVHEHIKDDWGKAVIFGAIDELKEDYRGNTIDGFEPVRVVSIETLFEPYDRINVMHVDVQGAEAAVITSAIETINRKLETLVVGTHTRQIEFEISELLARNDWDLQEELATEFQVASGRVVYSKDGCQWWINRRLSSK
jgi:FkbM family methyltransferase